MSFNYILIQPLSICTIFLCSACLSILEEIQTKTAVSKTFSLQSLSFKDKNSMYVHVLKVIMC